MAGLDLCAAALRALIGKGAFVRRDLSRRALFISDYRRRQKADEIERTEARLNARGWQVTYVDSLALLDWLYPAYQDFFASLQAFESAGLPENTKGLLRIYQQHQAIFLPEMLNEARAALLRWDAGENSKLLVQAGNALAVSLQKRGPVPGFFIPLLATMQDESKEVQVC